MKSIAFTSSILMASLLSPVKALEHPNAELTKGQGYKLYVPAFGEGPLLNGPTAESPLSI